MISKNETGSGFEVIILAGGLGTRLRAVVNDLPKPMAPVKNKPFLEHILLWLSRFNISKFVLSVGYQSGKITSYFNREFRNIPIEYSFEPYPLGTGGGIMQALYQVQAGNIIVVNGDTYFPIDLNDFFEDHLRSGRPVSMALKMMSDFDRYGSVIRDELGIITRFEEIKFRKKGLINGGIYIINQEYLKALKLPSLFSFEKVVLGKEALGEINSKIFEDPFIDIGVPEDYFKAEKVL